MDYGTNVKLGEGVFLNSNTVILDTCLVIIGARTIVGPGCSFYSGTHPLDPALRNGLAGPEFGKEIHVGEDCWLGGGVTVLPGVNIGRGASVGAGSVVTKASQLWISDSRGAVTDCIAKGRTTLSRRCWEPCKDPPKDRNCDGSRPDCHIHTSY